MEIKIEYLKIDELKPYEKNTRKHQEKDIKNIAKSIEKYGFNDAIGIWSDKNIIVEGHGRLLAAKRLGMKEVPVVRLDHLSDDQRREYAIAHNATAEISEWDFDILKEEMEDLDLNDFDFDFESVSSDDEVEIKTVDLNPYKKVHYLITVDINKNDQIIDIILKIKDIGGVEIESTLN